MNTKKNEKGERLPLMDELNELIEKERTLLSLKLLAQQNETETWKSKYDLLIDKVGAVAPGAVDNESRVLEAAAEIEDSVQAEPIKYEDVQRILLERISPWALDLNGVCLEKALLGKVSKEVFGPRGSFDNINSVYLRDCGLTDEFILPILSIVRSPRLQAIDLSRNEFSDVLFLQLLTALQDRRSTPQYVLLEDNPPMTSTVRHFEALLDALTEHTWGLTVSLRDFATPGEAGPPVSAKKAAAAARKEPNYDYKETAKPPMVANEFLRVFNSKLDPSNAVGNAQSNKAAKIAAKKAAVAAVKGAALGRLNALHTMSAFGLTHCHLSKRTVELLETTLHCLAPTLTDLDLSYAYIGYPGAEMLRGVLGDGGCQLVRLGLAGNALGDAGLTTLSQGLVANKTLTYLDLRSNNVGDSGLTALVPAVHRDGTVLDLLDLRANPIRQEAALSVTRQLDAQGSTLRVRFDAVIAAADAVAAVVSVAQPSALAASASILYSYPHQFKVAGAVSRPTKLHSIDLSKVYANHADKAGQAVELRWAWRPVPLGTHDTTGALLGVGASTTARRDAAELSGRDIKPTRTKKSAATPDRDLNSQAANNVADNAAYFKTGSSYAADWEIRVLLNNHEVSVHREHVAPSSAVTRSLLVRTPEWVSCCVLLSNLPFKGTVDMYAICTDSSTEPAASKPAQFVGFEVSAVHMTVPVSPSLSLPSSFSSPLGGDGNEFNAESTSAIAKMGLDVRDLHSMYPASKGMIILRKFRWSHVHSNASLSFDCKLISASGEDKASDGATTGGTATSSSLPPNLHTLGYVWAVYVLGAEGSARTAAEGMCVSGEREEEEENKPNQSSAQLHTWRWRQHQARLSGLHCDDTIVLAAKVISQQPSYPPALLAKCAISAKNCSFLADAGCSSGGATETTIIASYHPRSIDESSMYAEHDIHSLMLPM